MSQDEDMFSSAYGWLADYFASENKPYFPVKPKLHATSSDYLV